MRKVKKTLLTLFIGTLLSLSAVGLTACDGCGGHTHDLVHVTAIAATCEDTGNIEYWRCTDLTCGKKFSDQACTTEVSTVETSALGHNYDWVNILEATETTEGLELRQCLNCGKNDNETRVVEKIVHQHNIETTDSKPATCLETGFTKEECTLEGCSYEHYTVLPKLTHEFDQEASCEEQQECLLGCGYVKPASVHDYEEVTTEATCEVDGKIVRTCKNCGDVDEEVIPHTGHNVATWTYNEDKTTQGDADCEYINVFEGFCSNCEQNVEKTETAILHQEKVTITSVATCTTAGTKSYTCSVCGIETQASTSYEDNDAHSWGEPVNDNGKLTYTCAHNPEHVKVLLDYSAKNTANVDATAMQEVGNIKLSKAEMVLDETVKGQLSGNITVEADQVDKSGLQINDAELANQIGDKPIYNFGLMSGDDPVDFNGGKVTVTVEYQLEEGDDPENIGVWYIDEDGEIHQYPAKYSNGYAIFEAEHFSYYTVTRLTPAQRCAIYTHSDKVTEYPATCVADGYRVTVCIRCGRIEKVKTQSATGHNFSETVENATCVKNGKITKTCINENCGYQYVETIKATGHNYKLDEANSIAPTCTKVGQSVYTCENEGCLSTYSTRIPMVDHNLKITVLEPTCTESGKTTNTCQNEGCGYTFVNGYKPALGHDLVKDVVAPTCTEDGYTVFDCSRCDYQTEKTAIVKASHTWDIEQPTCAQGQKCKICGADGKPATGEHNVVDGVCTVCGSGCTHDNIETKVEVTCTEDGYTLCECKKCGAVTKKDVVKAQGHITDENGVICKVCGQLSLPVDFFINNTKSILNGKLSIKLENFTFPVDVRYNYFNQEVAVTFAEFYIGYEDGKLVGFGGGSCDFLVNGDKVKIDANAILDGEDVYVEFTNLPRISTSYYENIESSVEYTNMYAKSTITNLIGRDGVEIMDKFDAIMGYVDTVFTWYDNSLMPFIDSVLEINKEGINNLNNLVIANFFNVELKDNEYIISLDFDKIKELNEMLATKTVAEIFDVIFGENSFVSLQENLISILDMTLVEVKQAIEDAGFTVEGVIGLADSLVNLLTNGQFDSIETMLITMYGLPEDFSIEALLDNYIAKYSTVGNLIITLIGASNGAGDGGYQPEGPSMPNEGGDEIVIPGVDFDKNDDVVIEEIKKEEASLKADEKVEIEVIPNPDGSNDGSDSGIIIEKPGVNEGDGIYNPDEEGNVGGMPGVDGGLGMEITVDMIKGAISLMFENVQGIVLYQMIFQGFTPEQITEKVAGINGVIDFVKDAITIEMVASKTGEFKQANVKVNELEIEGQSISYDYAIVNNAELTIDYASKVQTIVNATKVLNITQDNYADLAMLGINVETCTPKFDENGKLVSVSEDVEGYIFGEEVDFYSLMNYGEEIDLSDQIPADMKDELIGMALKKMKYTKVIDFTNPSIEMTSDCGDWWVVSAGLPMQINQKSYVLETYIVHKGLGMFELVETPDVVEIEEESTENSIMNTRYFFNKTLNKIDVLDGYFMTKHEYVPLPDLDVEPVGCMGVGEKHFKCKNCEKTVATYFVNGHEFEEVYEFLTEDGGCREGLKVTSQCVNCGVKEDYSYQTYGHQTTYEYIDLSAYEGICEYHKKMGVCIERCKACDCIINLEADNMDFITEGNVSTYYCYDGNCSLTFTEEYDETKDECTTYYQADIKVMVNGEVIGTYLLEDYQTNHVYTYETTLKEGAQDCYDGYYIQEKCINCDYQTEVYEEIGCHPLMKSVSLSPYVTEGYIQYEVCACGKVSYGEFSVNGKYEYRTLEDNITNVYIFNENGFIIAERYEEVERGCDVYFVDTLMLNYNINDGSFDDSIVIESHRGYCHDYIVSAELIKGEGSSCEDGVTYIYTCSKCGDTDSWYTTWHERELKEVLDLKDYGSTCSTKLLVQKCACGRDLDFSLVDSVYNCDFSSAYDQEMTFNGIAFNNDSGNYRGGYYYNQANVYKCAVTDDKTNEELGSVPCNMEIFFGKNYIFNDTCYAQIDYLLAIGSNTDSPAIYTWKGEESFHSYAWGEFKYFEENNCAGEKEYKCQYCDEVLYTSNYTIHDFDDTRHQDPDSCEVYRNCTRCGEKEILTYEHTYGEDLDERPCYSLYICQVCGNEDRNVYHSPSSEWVTDKEATCSQPGQETYTYRCLNCDDLTKREVYTIEPGHKYEYNYEIGQYECTVCGMQNLNGADGTIILENCTTAEDQISEIFRVGYYVKPENKVEFIQAVTILVDGEEVALCEGIVIEDLGSYVTFSKAEAIAVATELGLTAGEFEVRLSFIPVGDDGTLDYGVTFTAEELFPVEE